MFQRGWTRRGFLILDTHHPELYLVNHTIDITQARGSRINLHKSQILRDDGCGSVFWVHSLFKKLIAKYDVIWYNVLVIVLAPRVGSTPTPGVRTWYNDCKRWGFRRWGDSFASSKRNRNAWVKFEQFYVTITSVSAPHSIFAVGKSEISLKAKMRGEHEQP